MLVAADPSPLRYLTRGAGLVALILLTGTVALGVLLAVVITSLLRTRLGIRTWRTVHWLSYLSWPVALAHGLGTGTDARLPLVQFLDVACVLVVLLAVTARLVHAPRLQLRLAGGTTVAVVVLVMAVWVSTGPLRPGWSRRAGTPASLLTAGSRAGPRAAASASRLAPTGTEGLPALPFQARLTGTVGQTGPDASGQVAITIDTRVSGSMTGALAVILRGRSAGTGVSLAGSSVTFGSWVAPTEYRGRVVALDGDQLVAEVRGRTGARLDLGLLLQINPPSGSVTGTLQAGPATRAFDSSGRDGDPDGGH